MKQYHNPHISKNIRDAEKRRTDLKLAFKNSSEKCV
jgi:hypothetical protein